MEAATVEGWVDAIRPLIWPAVLACGIWFAWRKQIIQTLVSRMTAAKGFGVAFEFSKSSAKRTQENLEEDLRDLRNRLSREMDELARRHRISEFRQRVLSQAVLPHVVGAQPNLRSTIHVEDPLLVDHLYQLLDYYPRGAGRGRAFSVRVGMIGRSWRLEQSDSKDLGALSSDDLVRDWGMTRAEADSSQAAGRSSFLAVLLRHEGVIAGVLYIDASPADAFGTDDAQRAEFRVRVENACEELGLTRALRELVDQANEWSPRVDPRGGT